MGSMRSRCPTALRLAGAAHVNPACHTDPFVFLIGNISTSIVCDHLQTFFGIHHVLGKINLQDTVAPFVGQAQVRLILAFITPSVPLVLLICCVGIEVGRRGSGTTSIRWHVPFSMMDSVCLCDWIKFVCVMDVLNHPHRNSSSTPRSQCCSEDFGDLLRGRCL